MARNGHGPETKWAILDDSLLGRYVILQGSVIGSVIQNHITLVYYTYEVKRNEKHIPPTDCGTAG